MLTLTLTPILGVLGVVGGGRATPQRVLVAFFKENTEFTEKPVSTNSDQRPARCFWLGRPASLRFMVWTLDKPGSPGCLVWPMITGYFVFVAFAVLSRVSVRGVPIFCT